MELLIGCMIYALIVQKVWSAAVTDHALAKQGIVSPRLQTKYGVAAAGKTAGYGFWDFLGDAYADRTQYKIAALSAAKDAPPAVPGNRVRLRDRLAAANTALTASVGRIAAHPVTKVARKLIDPVPPRVVVKDSEIEDEPIDLQSGITTGMHHANLPAGTIRFFGNGGMERWDGTGWRLARMPEPSDDPLPCGGCGLPFAKHIIAAVPGKREPELYCPINPDPSTSPVTAPRPAATPATTPSTGGTAMTAPTGEAVNYETTIATLEALATEQRGHVDHCMAAKKSLDDAKSAINNMQESYRASAAAAQSTSEHLAAKNLDGVTLSHAGTTVDAMPAGAVDAMYDQLEAMEAEASARLADAEVALGSTEANLSHVVATYSAAHETVAGNLGGDSSFLDSGGSVAVGSAPVASSGSAPPPAPAAAPRSAGPVASGVGGGGPAGGTPPAQAATTGRPWGELGDDSGWYGTQIPDGRGGYG